MSTPSGSKNLKKQHLSVFELSGGEVLKPASILTTDLPEFGSDVERISSGTKFAIDQWIKKTSKNDTK